MKSMIITCIVSCVIVGISVFERYRWSKKAKAEHQDTIKRMEAEQAATLKRMEAEFIRLANKMQLDHDTKLAKLANSQAMRALIEQPPIIINGFNYARTDWLC